MTTYYRSSFDYDTFVNEYECLECTKNAQILDDIREQFHGVLEQIYGENELNIMNLEQNLAEIAFFLEIRKLPAHLPKIKRS